jgi:hypothetical protein
MEIMEEDKQCICCGKVKDVLISVIRTEERGGIFIRYRGICQECILKEDIEKVTKDFEIKMPRRDNKSNRKFNFLGRKVK